MHRKVLGVFLALAAALFYALNVPLSKLLLMRIQPTMMAAFLYLGAGIGITLTAKLGGGRGAGEERLSRQDLPFVIGMIVLDIAAPILLMFGLRLSSAAGAALLNNFEIVATALIALFVFRERISFLLWGGLLLISLASVLLSGGGDLRFQFSTGSLLVLAAASCWGLENNFTRRISDKNTYQIVMLKGIFSGLGALAVAFSIGESLPPFPVLAQVLLLGFVAYGLSIFMYIKAQNILGAAKTSAYYAVAPFAGAALAFLIHREELGGYYFAALAVMIAGSILVVADTLLSVHRHAHRHAVTHTHNSCTHTHVFMHTHCHIHGLHEETHEHRHADEEVHRLSGHGLSA